MMFMICWDDRAGVYVIEPTEGVQKMLPQVEPFELNHVGPEDEPDTVRQAVLEALERRGLTLTASDLHLVLTAHQELVEMKAILRALPTTLEVDAMDGVELARRAARWREDCSRLFGFVECDIADGRPIASMDEAVEAIRAHVAALRALSRPALHGIRAVPRDRGEVVGVASTDAQAGELVQIRIAGPLPTEDRVKVLVENLLADPESHRLEVSSAPFDASTVELLPGPELQEPPTPSWRDRIPVWAPAAALAFAGLLGVLWLAWGMV